MIHENLSRLRERINSACARAGRDLREIAIIAVSKGRPLEQIKGVIAEGIHDIGESRVRETLPKYNALRHMPRLHGVRWHMVGHLQANKAKAAVGIFDLIHSVDSLDIAEEISRQASRIGKVQDVLIEIKTSPEAAKLGLRPEEAVEAIKQMSGLKNINLKGLMTIAPIVDSPEKTRPYFRRLRQLMDEINEFRIANSELRILSMGMTDDFEIAVEEGATMLRLGRAVFEG